MFHVKNHVFLALGLFFVFSGVVGEDCCIEFPAVVEPFASSACIIVVGENILRAPTRSSRPGVSRLRRVGVGPAGGGTPEFFSTGSLMAWKIAKRFRVAERMAAEKARRRAPRRALPKMGKGLSKPVAAAVRKIAKAVIVRRAETKIMTQETTLDCTSLQAGTTSLVGNYLIISPSSVSSSYAYIPQRGFENDQVVGNKFTTKKCSIGLSMRPNAYNATTNPFLVPMNVRAYVFRSKTQPVTDLVAADFCGGSAIFFEDGNGYEGFAGNLMDLNRRITSDNFVYLGHRDFKIGQAVPSGSSPTSPLYNASNNDYKLNYTFNWNVTKFMQKSFEFNDDDSIITPYTFLLFQVIPVAAGTSYTANTMTPLNIQLKIQYEYQDV